MQRTLNQRLAKQQEGPKTTQKPSESKEKLDQKEIETRKTEIRQQVVKNVSSQSKKTNTKTSHSPKKQGHSVANAQSMADAFQQTQLQKQQRNQKLQKQAGKLAKQQQPDSFETLDPSRTPAQQQNVEQVESDLKKSNKKYLEKYRNNGGKFDINGLVLNGEEAVNAVKFADLDPEAAIRMTHDTSLMEQGITKMRKSTSKAKGIKVAGQSKMKPLAQEGGTKLSQTELIALGLTDAAFALGSATMPWQGGAFERPEPALT